MSGGRAANLFWGSMNFLYIILFSVVLPMWTLTALTSLSISDISITFGQEDFFEMTVWLLRIGIVMAAFAFFKGSSPKYSRRRAIGALLETIAEIFYIFMYKFSGTSNIHLVGPNLFINLNLDKMLTLYMGMILLYVFYNIWDIIDTHFWGRERAEKEIKKKMEKKWKKIMKKQGYVPPATESPVEAPLSASKAKTTPTQKNDNEEANFLA